MARPAPPDIKAAADRAASPKTPPAANRAVKAAAARAARSAGIKAALAKRIAKAPR
jgi:hypothetical protein